MVGLQSVKIFGPPPGAAGVSVIEQTGTAILADPRYGSAGFVMVAKRGPMGLFIPLSSKAQYEELYGDKNNPAWALYENGAHLGPDAVDGFFNTSAGTGQLWLLRVEFEKARRSVLTLKNRQGADALRIYAANPGRWGGYKNKIPMSTVVFATARTFTIVYPGVESNEFIDAKAEFSSGTGKQYDIVANTASNPSTGEVIFTVGAQYDMAFDGVTGPLTIDGFGSYVRQKILTGTISFSPLANLTGIAGINNTVVTGLNTLFSQELRVGQNLYFNGEARRIESISSNTTLTISEPFSVNANNATLQRDNLMVNGNATAFTTELRVGDPVYVSIDGQLMMRQVAAIANDVSLTLDSGFDADISAGTTAFTDNYWVVGNGSDYQNDLRVGDQIIDPNRQGDSATVVEIDAANQRFRVALPFALDFSEAQLTKQTQKVQLTLDHPSNVGLAVEVGQGTRYPATHFSLKVYFNGSLVMSSPDVSLDPKDPYFVEPIVNDGNIAYRTASTNYQAWITAESLWDSAYTTAATNDIRPCNGAGVILAVTPQRLYTVSEFDYAATIGRAFFPNPYRFPRDSIRIKSASPPVKIEGTISSFGVNITGTNTAFRSIFKPGDYLYDPLSRTARKIRVVISNTQLILHSVFPQDIPAGTRVTKVGYLAVDQGIDLTKISQVGDRYMVSFPEPLVGGYDGDTANMIPFDFTRYFDIDRNYLETAVFGRNVGLVRVTCPGVSSISVQKAGIEYCSYRAYEYRVEIPSNITSSAVAEAYINQDMERSDNVSVAFPSYGYISNPKGFGDRLISLSGDIMGLESYKSSLHQGYHYVAAGIDARLSRVTKLPFNPNPADEAILNMTGIQPIKIFGGKVVIFGARMPSNDQAKTFLHVARTQNNYIRVFIESQGLMQALFQPNQPELAQQIIMVLEEFAKKEYKKGVYTRYLSFDQAVRVSTQPANTLGQESVSMSDADVVVSIVNGKLSIYYSYVPTGILEKLQIFVGPDSIVSRFGSSVNI